MRARPVTPPASRSLTRLSIVWGVLIALVTAPGLASAEWFADLYAGAAFTQRQHVDERNTSGGVDVKITQVDFDRSPSFGGRVGYWFEQWPFLGLGIDAFHFRPNAPAQDVGLVIPALGFDGNLETDDFDIAVTAISFDLLLRWPLLASSGFPRGRLQPYVTAGPTLFVTRVEDTTNFGPPFNQTDTDTTVGVKAAAGLAWLLHRRVAVFAEYRYTHFHPAVGFREVCPAVPAPGCTFPGAGKELVDFDLNTHHLLAGISFRF